MRGLGRVAATRNFRAASLKGWDVTAQGIALVITHISLECEQMARGSAEGPLRPVYGPSPREAGLSLGVYAEVAARAPPLFIVLVRARLGGRLNHWARGISSFRRQAAAEPSPTKRASPLKRAKRR
jgi:hypothetical protein